MSTEKTISAPYLPHATLLTALDHLKSMGIPNRIERRTFPSLSPGATSQVISAFRYLDLIKEDGTPEPLLTDFVHKVDERKAIMRQLIETHYPDIVALDFAKITATQLESALAGKRYNATGETRKKAKTFLLKAAQYAGFTVHPLLIKITRNRNKGSGKKSISNGSKTETGNGGSGERQAKKEEPVTPASPPLDPNIIQMPIPLGPGRTAYIQLPHDWNAKELKKLISILQLSLSAEEPGGFVS